MTFFCRDSQNSVRAALRDQIGKKESSIVQMSEERQYYLNLIDTEFYKPGLFDADHLQPSSGLIERLKEMVEMMNIDPVTTAAAVKLPRIQSNGSRATIWGKDI